MDVYRRRETSRDIDRIYRRRETSRDIDKIYRRRETSIKILYPYSFLIVRERTRDFSCSFSARANCENVKLSHAISKGTRKAHAANARGNMAVFGLHSMYLVIYRFGASCWLTTLLICRWFQKISRASLKVHGATRA